MIVWVLIAVLQTGATPLAVFLSYDDCARAALNALHDREICEGFPLLGQNLAQPAPTTPPAAPAPPKPAAAAAPTPPQPGRVFKVAPKAKK